MRDNLDDHSRFEELCALEILHQLSQQERLELLTHCSSCPDCEAWRYDAHAISSQLLISHQFSVESEALPIGAEIRFIAEARRRGLSLLHSPRSIYRWQMKLAAAGIMLVALGMAIAISLHQATRSVTQEATASSEARPYGPGLSASPAPTSSSREPLLHREIPRRAKRETRSTRVAQHSPHADWSQQSTSFQMRSVLFDLSDCCLFVPQRGNFALQSPDVHALHELPALGGVWPLGASPKRDFRYEAALLSMGASVSPTQPRSISFPSPQFPPFNLNFEHTR